MNRTEIARRATALPTVILATFLPGVAVAGLTVYEEGSAYVKVGGRVQAQYHRIDPDGGSSTDEARVRRAWLTFDAAAVEDWKGRLQFQLNGGLSTRDAKIQYTGWDLGTLTVGNFYVPFSREELTSTRRQQLVEKTPVAGTGSPGRQLGVSLAGGGDTLGWRVGVWEAGLETDTSDIDFGSQIDGKQDYEGLLVGGRVEFHPGGDIAFGQGNLGGQRGWEIAVNGFSWSNDDDRVNDASNDYDRVTGAGFDGAWRSGGWSIDAEYNTFSAETLGSGVTQGIVDAGDADVETFSIEGGYLFRASGWEVVAGIGTEEADAWSETETQTGLGINRFFSGHQAKLQATLVETTDRGGVSGADRTDLYVQLQFAF